MYSSRKKIQKDKDVEPTEFEDTVAQVTFYAALWQLVFHNICQFNILNVCLILMQYLFDLENTNQELKSDLKDLYINSAACVFWLVLSFSNMG